MFEVELVDLKLLSVSVFLLDLYLVVLGLKSQFCFSPYHSIYLYEDSKLLVPVFLLATKRVHSLLSELNQRHVLKVVKSQKKIQITIFSLVDSAQASDLEYVFGDLRSDKHILHTYIYVMRVS